MLQDRRIPRTRANIDHIVVSRNGVFVVDAKKYKGRPALRVEGGLFRPRTETLVVGGRNCTKLVDGVLKQVDLVRAALDDDTVTVTGVLCFVAADWPLIGGAFETRGVHVLWSKRLVQLVTAERPARAAAPPALDVASVRARIVRAFPPA
ncbi:nuclease-related domain-containing protein [Terrabacter carboxydivorans]|uniref:NERD domain-containing protein n=1 Tax=Terrabacter carboxydivorans TaxID=619730 RepID=A0ABP5ZBG5_9MICO